MEKQMFEHLPKNVLLYSWLPQLKVLDHADCSINHGGIHTINECIHFSVPMLVFSGKKYDQNGCAARVAYYGAGIVGDKDKESSVSIRDKIGEVLSNTEIAKKIQHLNQAYYKRKHETIGEKIGIIKKSDFKTISAIN